VAEQAETHFRWADGLQAALHPADARRHLLAAETLFQSRNLRRRAALVRTTLVALAQ